MPKFELLGVVLSSATLTQRWWVRCPHCRWYTTSRRHRPPPGRPRTPGPRRLAHTPTEVLRSGARQRRVRQRLDPDSAKERTISCKVRGPRDAPGTENREHHARTLHLSTFLPTFRVTFRATFLTTFRTTFHAAFCATFRTTFHAAFCATFRVTFLTTFFTALQMPFLARPRAQRTRERIVFRRVPSRAPIARPTRSSTPYVSAVSGSSVSATWISSAFQPGNATLCDTTL